MLEDIIILAGGLGTRLQSVTRGTPKALVPIGERRVFLDYLFDWLFPLKPKRIVLSLCYSPEAFQDYLNTRQFSFQVQLVIEPKPLGTGGAICHVIEELGISGPFGVLNGDTYGQADFETMMTHFYKLRCSAMIGLSYVSDTQRYGSVIFEDHRALAFREKELSKGPGWVNNGCYLFSPEVFEGYTGTFSVEQDIFPSLCRRNQLFVFQMAGEFVDIGLPEDYYKFVDLFNHSSRAG